MSTPQKPETHSGNLARLPAALMPLALKKRWVNWNWELRHNQWTKPPRQPNNLKYAKANDPATWGDYGTALKRVQDGDADGLGFMLAGSGIGALDLDHCCERDAVADKTDIDSWARELCAEANDAYCEVTVSGFGLRLIGIAEKSEVHRRFKIPDAHPEAGIELFRNTARYITISGLEWGSCQELPAIDDLIDAALTCYGNYRNYDNLIRNGVPEGQRSEAFQAVVWHLASRCWSVKQIVNELQQYPSGIAVKYADRLPQEVARSYWKWQQQNYQKGQLQKPQHGLPIIRVEEGRMADMVDAAQIALIEAQVPLFVRGRMLVEPITAERQAAHTRTTQVTVFAPVGERKLAYQLNKQAAQFQRLDGRRDRWVPIDPPTKITGALQNLRSWRFPEVVGIINAPTMRPDGSILSDCGYDPSTRLWCNSDIELPDIPQRPTRADAEQALGLLKGLLSGFPFVGPADRSVALAAILTAVLRGAVDVVPLFAILAHTSGTGKSFLVDLIAVIVTGRPCPVTSGSKSPEEMEKRLGSLLLEGASITSLDNLSHDIEGDLLAQMVTQSFVKARILGRSEMPECEWRGILFATGNNIRVIGDMVRRTLVCQLDAKVERPELRRFEFDPMQRVHENRADYIAAALTISRAYMTGADAIQVTPLAGFRAWSKVVREPLIWLGESDPVDSMEAARTADPQRAAARQLLRHLEQCIGVDIRVAARAIVKTANETLEIREFLLEHVATRNGEQIDPVRLGKWLQSEHGRVYGNLRIEISSGKGRANEYVLRRTDSGSSI